MITVEVRFSTHRRARLPVQLLLTLCIVMSSAPILFLPIIDWEFRMQRPQQLARCFARAGTRVYYPDLRLRAEPAPPRLVETNLWRIALVGDPEIDPYRDTLDRAGVDRALAGLASLGSQLDGCWVVAHLPFWRPLAAAVRELAGGRLLFDCMDDFSSFGDHADLWHEEQALTVAADLVAVSSEALRAKLGPLARRTVLVRNGCDPDHFGVAAARPPASDRSVVVGFFGGIHDWFDTSLVAHLAGRHPDWQVWLVGDTYRADVEELRRLPNVAFLGEVPYAFLPRIVSSFAVGIIPFKITPLTLATNPVKVYEMLAAGLPVVTVDLPELRRLEPLVAVARDADHMVACVEEALATDSAAAREERRDFARRQSWVERFLALRGAMAEVEDGAGDEGATLSERGAAAPPEPGELVIAGELERERGGMRDPSMLMARLAVALFDRDALYARTAHLEDERSSLVEQRDRVEAEAERLRSELARVEAERLALERRLQEVTASRLWRTGERLRHLRRSK